MFFASWSILKVRNKDGQPADSISNTGEVWDDQLSRNRSIRIWALVSNYFSTTWRLTRCFYPYAGAPVGELGPTGVPYLSLSTAWGSEKNETKLGNCSNMVTTNEQIIIFYIPIEVFYGDDVWNKLTISPSQASPYKLFGVNQPSVQSAPTLFGPPVWGYDPQKSKETNWQKVRQFRTLKLVHQIPGPKCTGAHCSNGPEIQRFIQRIVENNLEPYVGAVIAIDSECSRSL